MKITIDQIIKGGQQNQRMTANIQEDECIGCTKCIQACPTDAIIGASKLMHTVIARACIGCELCIAPCPVDCIEMISADALSTIEKTSQVQHWRDRYDKRQARLLREKAERKENHNEKKRLGLKQSIAERQTLIQAAVARVKAKRKCGESN